MHSFGDPRIDADHDRIICEFDAMCRVVCQEEFSVSEHEAWAKRFLRYTREHFRREELLMRRSGFSSLTEHTLAHAYLQREFQEHLRTLRPGNPNLRTSLEVVRRIFLAHIVTYDEAFGIWLEAARPGRTASRRIPIPFPLGFFPEIRARRDRPVGRNARIRTGAGGTPAYRRNLGRNGL